MFFIGIVSIIIIVIAFCLFIDRVVLWDCDEHGSGIKGYINKKIKHSCVNCKYRDEMFCRNPKVLELEARDAQAYKYDLTLKTEEARKYSIFCYKRRKDEQEN